MRVVSTSNQELAALTGQRNNLEAELVAKAAQIERANGQLEALETNQQTASNEFEALTERKSGVGCGCWSRSILCAGDCDGGAKSGGLGCG